MKDEEGGSGGKDGMEGDEEEEVRGGERES